MSSHELLPHSKINLNCSLYFSFFGCLGKVSIQFIYFNLFFVIFLLVEAGLDDASGFL